MRKRFYAALLTLVLLIGCMPLPSSAAESVDFADLKGHWAREYVLPLAQDGVISGKSAGVFDPESNITRAEFITLVANLTNLHEDEESPYADISANAWFAKTISAAKAYGVIDDTMTADGNFYPDTPITREEMTSVVVRLAEKIRGTLLNTKNGFSDEAGFGDWAKDYIAKAAGEGIVTGNTDGTFNAKGNATRAEAAVIIKRFRDLLNQPVRTLQAGEYHPVYDGVIYEVDLQKMIDDAYASGQKTLTLEKGVYRLSPQSKGGHLRFVDMKDFTLDGNGSTLLFSSPSSVGVLFENSENVSIKNMNTDCEKLSFYQARITAIDPDNMSIDIVVPNGFRDYFDDSAGFSNQIYIEFHDGETGDYLQSVGSNTLTFSRLEKLGNRKYRLNSGTIAKAKGLKVGDYLSGGDRKTTGNSVQFKNSKECKLTNYAMWSGQVGLYMTGGYGGHVIDNVRLEPGPRPLGATEDRVMSSVADAAHIQFLEVGPTIQNSIFRNCGDDGFNNYGKFYRVAERLSDSELILASSTDASGVLVGDTLRFYTADGDLVGTSAITSVTESVGYTSKVDLNATFDSASFTARKFYKVRLATAVKGIAATNWITNASRNCSGFVLKNNYYANIRSRGILIKGSDGVIEGNTIYNTGASGILLAPEFNWMESDYVRNVVVRNNILDSNGLGGGRYGSIYIHGYKDARENRDITIEGNTIRNAGSEAFEISGVNGLIIRNNTVESRHPDYTDSMPMMLIDKSENVEVSGNKYPTDWTEIKVTEDTKNINIK